VGSGATWARQGPVAGLDDVAASADAHQTRPAGIPLVRVRAAACGRGSGVPGGRGVTVPRIHDITTDTDDPPVFVAVLAHRQGAWNPADYDGPAVAAQQRAAWPDLGPLDLTAPRSRVHAAARAEIAHRGWRLVGDDAAAGRLEAIATTRWLRFKDDVVVRLRDRPDGGTRVDMRSKSRIGRSDLGTNARRIRTFLRALRARIEVPT
jgi:uncharacterized protein (DUF1499 family)